MADDKPLKVRHLSSERWHWLIKANGLDTAPEQIRLEQPIEISGVIFLPAIYRPA